MRELIRLALRSLLRNRRRSAITLGAVALGVAVVIFAHGFGDGLMQMMVRNVLENRVGAIQIHKKGWLEASEAAPLKLDLEDPEALIARVRAVPGVSAVTPRLRFGAIVSDGRQSSIVIGEGVDPERELTVCPHRAADVDEAKGSFVSSAMPRGGVLGQELARAFDAKRGDSLTLSASGREGGVNALDLEVAGVTRGASSLFESKRSVVVPIAYAQELLQMTGRVTELAVRVDDLDRIPEVAAALQQALGPDVEVSTWDEVVPFLMEAVGRLKIVLTGVSAVLFFIVIFGVINTMLMNVYERVREIGTMLAVGVRRSQVLALFLFEAAAIGLVGGVIGAALGLALTALSAIDGMSLTPPGGVFPQIIYPVARLDIAALALVVAVLGAIVAAAWPARRASLMNPVEALRTL
jgi:putative ABC transport system permease protein